MHSVSNGAWLSIIFGMAFIAGCSIGPTPTVEENKWNDRKNIAFKAISEQVDRDDAQRRIREKKIEILKSLSDKPPTGPILTVVVMTTIKDGYWVYGYWVEEEPTKRTIVISPNQDSQAVPKEIRLSIPPEQIREAKSESKSTVMYNFSFVISSDSPDFMAAKELAKSGGSAMFTEERICQDIIILGTP